MCCTLSLRDSLFRRRRKLLRIVERPVEQLVKVTVAENCRLANVYSGFPAPGADSL